MIETDPHVLKPTYALPKSYSDFTFCMQEDYLERGDIYLPYNYDPTVHYPIKTLYPHEKEYDVCLVGLLYPQRASLINKLRADGLKVFYDIGLIMDEYREVYNKSKIALSWSTLNDTPARVFEGMAMKLPVVANRTPDAIHLFEDGKDFLGFDDCSEGEQQVLRLINDTGLRAEIAENGYNAVRPYTYDMSIVRILNICGLI